MDVLSSKQVKIRKPHNCWGCMEEFPKGSHMERMTSVDAGDFITVYWCDICLGFCNVVDKIDGITYGEFITEYRDELEEYARMVANG